MATDENTVAGCVVTSGEIIKDTCTYRLVRGDDVVWEGEKLSSLKRFKDDVNKVAKGTEFGAAIPFSDIRPGDRLHAIVQKPTKRKLRVHLG